MLARAFLIFASLFASAASAAPAIDPQFGKDHRASFETEKDIGFDNGTTMVFRLYFQNNDGHSMGRVRLSATNMPSNSAASSLSIVIMRTPRRVFGRA